MTIGVGLSQKGFAVGGDRKNQILLPDANTYKPFAVIELSVSVPGTPGDETEVSQAHGLNFPPAFSAMAKGNVNTDWRNVPFAFTDLGLDLRVHVNSTNVTAYVRNTAATDSTITFKVIIFENELV